MEQVGIQTRLGFERAFQIAVQGIRIRFGRSLVTISGVVLGIAFLMSNLTAQFIKKSVAKEQELRQTVALMQAMIQAEVGELTGKKIAVVTFGNRTPTEDSLLTKLVNKTQVVTSAQGASLLLVLGDGKQSPSSLNVLAEGMMQRVVLDSLSARVYPASDTPNIRRELFFGNRHDEETAVLQEQARQQTFRTRWIVIVSLLVTVIGVSNALLMSVTERFREIGTMKCLGALSSFIRQLFLIESALIGLAGSIVGALLGMLLSIVAYGFNYSFAMVLSSMPFGWLVLTAAGAIVVGTILSMAAAIYPARIASRMVPASALRSTV